MWLAAAEAAFVPAMHMWHSAGVKLHVRRESAHSGVLLDDSAAWFEFLNTCGCFGRHARHRVLAYHRRTATGGSRCLECAVTKVYKYSTTLLSCPSLISRTVSVDVKRHVYLLTLLSLCG